MDTGDLEIDELAAGEELFEMANVRPEVSGLPFIVWISEKGRARHDVRVNVSPGPRVRQFVASVSVRPVVDVVAGALPERDLGLLRAWIDLNRDVIVRYWDGDIVYTDEALAALDRSDAELARIAEAGRARTLADHTAARRARQMVAALDMVHA